MAKLEASGYKQEPLFCLHVGAIALIYNNNRQARKRATIDLALHESQNVPLLEAKKKVSEIHESDLNVTELAFENNNARPENKYIQTVLNNYEFIAAGIKEGALDEEIYKRMRRSIVIRDWDAFSAYIVELRRARKRDKLFIEFQWLAERWRKNETKPDVSWMRKLLTKIGL